MTYNNSIRNLSAFIKLMKYNFRCRESAKMYLDVSLWFADTRYQPRFSCQQFLHHALFDLLGFVQALLQGF